MSEIKEPFLTVLHLGGSVDYKDKGAKTHEFVKKLGYEPKMNSDCSITADGLKGINLTSYGDWGSVYHRLWTRLQPIFSNRWLMKVLSNYGAHEFT